MTMQFNGLKKKWFLLNSPSQGQKTYENMLSAKN